MNVRVLVYIAVAFIPLSTEELEEGAKKKKKTKQEVLLEAQPV